MTLKLYFHPLSSFCQKVLIALYEKELPFEKEIVDFMDPVASASFTEIWPIRQFPVLRDEANGRTIPESSMIIEYLDQHYPGKVQMLPADRELAFRARQLDRFFDLHVQAPMQKVVTDNFRPKGYNDPFGVEEARGKLKTAYSVLEKELAGKRWATGDQYTMADCAGSPALFYANLSVPFAGHSNLASYLERLMNRPSFARAVEEARPYFSMRPE
ncbi:glutathione S-transferase family protein [Phyllobacterium lublinensis]|uniref:glutathione S-transferase family protein n=1 Tax=Phyllobacterium lublinensis TaxID=2875708 RepID=UPI001CCFC1D3|nr:glutathione S-transferase family protein [Phyllobacterium sp. 2063]MBZ9655167.1 glutathione S-transferase family protein [Phyllobacterium sp. 2063]